MQKPLTHNIVSEVFASYSLQSYAVSSILFDTVEYEDGLPYVFSDHSRTRVSPI